MKHPKLFQFLAIVVIVAATWIVYGRALDVPFVFDDSGSIAENASVFHLWPLIGDAEHPGPLNPAHDLPTSGRPLVNLSLAVNYRLGEANPLGYHLFNLVVHTLSALLLMAIVRRILALDFFAGAFAGAEGALAFVVALLWALHPVQTETVVYITQRTELLVGFFYLATLYSSLRYWQADSPAARGTWLTLATLACLCGMASKEVMVTAPVVILLLERTLLRGSFRQALKQSWPLYAGLALGWALLALLNYSAPRSDSAGFHAGIPALTWWFTQCKVLWLYVKLVFWPWPLLIHYEMPYLTTLSAAWPWVLASGLLVAGILVLLWRRSAIGYAGAWMLLILSPTLVVPIVTEVAAERRLYLPLAAMLTLLVTGGYWCAMAVRKKEAVRKTNRGKPDAKFIAVFATIVSLLAIPLALVNARRLQDYRDPITLWEGALASHPNDPISQNNLGVALLAQGRTEEAISHIEQGIQDRPDLAVGELNLGIALDRTDRKAEAIEHYRKALQLKTDFPAAEYNLGLALESAGQTSAAIEHLQHALEEKPSFAEARNNLGIALSARQSRAGRDRTVSSCTAVEARLLVSAAEPWSGAGKMGRLDDALKQFQETLRMNPDCVDAYANMAKAYVILKQPEEAIRSAEKGAALARSLGQNSMAEQFDGWLTTFRAQQAEAGTKPAETAPSKPSP